MIKLHRCSIPELSVGVFLFFLLCIQGTALAHSWKSPKEAAAVKNPLPASAETEALGQRVYQNFCTACHGENARGGQKAVQEGGPVPPDIVLRLSHHSHGDFFWKISHGRGDMPGFGEDLAPEEIWSIVWFLESLSP